MQNRRVALIPAYQPNSDMAQLVQEIKDAGFQIVVMKVHPRRKRCFEWLRKMQSF